MFYGLRYPSEQIMWVVGLVACGCPVAAIVTVFEIDERGSMRKNFITNTYVPSTYNRCRWTKSG